LTENGHGGNVLGVLGGLGPLASAEFVRTIYSYGAGGPEQEFPVVLLYSDPSFPDRTECLRGASPDEVLLGRLTDALTRLCEMGASRLVICCVTAHHFLPRLPPHLRGRILSLVDLIFDAVMRSPKRRLLLCSNGSRQARIFQSHPLWEANRGRVVLPDADDQDAIHNEIIHRLKRNVKVEEVLPSVSALLSKYGVDSFIAGCTEIHLVARHLAAAGSHSFIDPLTAIAESFAPRRRAGLP
jgi:aspartate racemase